MEVAESGSPSADHGSLFAISGALEPPALPPVEPGAPTWIHGDFHPDQVVPRRGSRDWMLMDLDLVGLGDPTADLASWIADALYEQPDCCFSDAAGALLEGYAHAARPVEPRRLEILTAHALVDRAAGSIRRLEQEASEKARTGLERARSLAEAAQQR